MGVERSSCQSTVVVSVVHVVLSSVCGASGLSTMIGGSRVLNVIELTGGLDWLRTPRRTSPLSLALQDSSIELRRWTLGQIATGEKHPPKKNKTQCSNLMTSGVISVLGGCRGIRLTISDHVICILKKGRGLWSRMRGGKGRDVGRKKRKVRMFCWRTKLDPPKSKAFWRLSRRNFLFKDPEN